MKNCEVSEKDDKYMSWDEFKVEYLPKVYYLAAILRLNRSEVIDKVEVSRHERHPERKMMDDDYWFVNGVMNRILDREGKWGDKPLLYELNKTDGAEKVFDELYRVWLSRFSLSCPDTVFFRKTYQGSGMRSEPGKGDIIDIFLMNREGGATLLNVGTGEDFAYCGWPVAVKVKHKGGISNEELIKTLRDLADALESRFNNCYVPSLDGYTVPNSKEEQAVLCGLYENNPNLHLRVKWNPGEPLDKVIEKAGWIDPNVSLDTGLGEMLKKGWPELYKRALSHEMTPFEALLETGLVGPRTVYEVLTSDEDLLSELDDL